jgi:hypothetical protein
VLLEATVLTIRLVIRTSSREAVSRHLKSTSQRRQAQFSRGCRVDHGLPTKHQKSYAKAAVAEKGVYGELARKWRD